MSKPVSLLGHMHVCPMVNPGPRPHVGGPVASAGQSLVRYEGVPLAVEGGECLCTGMPGPDGMTEGSALVRIGGKGVMRMGDGTAHGGNLTMGVPTLRAD